MKPYVGALLLFLVPGLAQAEGINERSYPDPGTAALAARVTAQAWATQPPQDVVSVQRGGQYQGGGGGVGMNLSVGSVYANGSGQTPREVNVVTRDVIQICLQCR
jgi:hypothetical protein